MDDSVLKRSRPALALVAAGVLGFLGGCAFYAPDVVDCSVRCGENDACPSSTVCKDGFCRPKDATTRCDCKPGDTRPCGGGKGECTQGLQSCTESGAWTACLGEGKPSEEKCDGKDNNCDGVVDNSVADPPLCEKSLGVCGAGRQVCVAASFQACTAADYGPFYEPVEVSCDGMDNDCDGFVDSTAPVVLATGVVSPYAFLAEPAGFAAVYADGTGLVVSRYDQALAKQGTTTVVAGLAPQLLGAAIDGADVYVAWAADGGVAAARVSPSLTGPEYLPVLANAQASSDLSVGARPGELVVGFLAAADTRAELAVWPLDGGAPTKRTLSTGTDGGVWTELTYMTVSNGGRYAAFKGSYLDNPDPDAGASSTTEYRTVLASPPYTVVDTSYLGSNGTLLEEGTRLTYTYSYSFFSIIPFIDSYSGVYFKKNLLVNGDEVAVKRVDKEADVFGEVHAMAVNGQVLIVYMDRQTSRLVLGAESRSGSLTTFRLRDVSNDGGYGIPRLAGLSPYLALAWEQNGVLSAQRTCSP
ncbi:MAG: hypothetical protein AB1730_00680 [Myxococcota bacterium]